MTPFAFILGVVPLVIASGAGAEMRQPLGTAVFVGTLGVTLFGLVFTPVLRNMAIACARRRSDQRGVNRLIFSAGGPRRYCRRLAPVETARTAAHK